MNEIEIIGCLSAFLTTASFLPQTLKTIVKQETNGISALMYIAFTLGICGWIVYGIMKKDVIIVLANSITVVLSAAILTIKLRNIWRKGESF